LFVLGIDTTIASSGRCARVGLGGGQLLGYVLSSAVAIGAIYDAVFTIPAESLVDLSGPLARFAFQPFFALIV
jgi:hypothetical protein